MSRSFGYYALKWGVMASIGMFFVFVIHGAMIESGVGRIGILVTIVSWAAVIGGTLFYVVEEFIADALEGKAEISTE